MTTREDRQQAHPCRKPIEPPTCTSVGRRLARAYTTTAALSRHKAGSLWARLDGSRVPQASRSDTTFGEGAPNFVPLKRPDGATTIRRRERTATRTPAHPGPSGCRSACWYRCPGFFGPSTDSSPAQALGDVSARLPHEPQQSRQHRPPRTGKAPERSTPRLLTPVPPDLLQPKAEYVCMTTIQHPPGSAVEHALSLVTVTPSRRPPLAVGRRRAPKAGAAPVMFRSAVSDAPGLVICAIAGRLTPTALTGAVNNRG